MKIRSGYVSNSSSSSFLICFNDENEFSKFDKFNMYKNFMTDIKNKTFYNDESSIELINSILFEYLYSIGDNVSFEVDYVDYQQYYDILDFIDYTVCSEDWTKLKEEIDNYKKEFWKKLKEQNPIFQNLEFIPELVIYRSILSNEEQIIYDKQKQNYWHEFHTFLFDKETKKKLLNIAKDVYEQLKEKFKYVCSLTYSDDNEIGSYMTYDFIPFISRNPEAEYQIFSIHNH